MPTPNPIYTSENTKVAYQLNWSLTLFLRHTIPTADQWLEKLRDATSNDGVRILEVSHLNDLAVQYWLSTQPQLSPSATIRFIKGRLQYQLRDSVPKLFQRNYAFTSVGEVNSDCLNGYVAKQPSRHPMVDPRVNQLIQALQFHDNEVDLTKLRSSEHGKFTHNLHMVFENREHLHDVSEASLQKIRAVIIGTCEKRGCRLARIGLLSNHVHLLIGSNVTESPQEIALALMNNWSYAFGMKAVLEYSYYVGTFGPYDRGAIRRCLQC